MDFAFSISTAKAFGACSRRSATPGGRPTSRRSAEGREIVVSALIAIDTELAGKDYVAGGFAADAALFYGSLGRQDGHDAAAHRQAHYALMKTRPAVRQVLAEEGHRS
jgi:glutathione S-transferase